MKADSFDDLENYLRDWASFKDRQVYDFGGMACLLGACFDNLSTNLPPGEERELVRYFTDEQIRFIRRLSGAIERNKILSLSSSLLGSQLVEFVSVEIRIMFEHSIDRMKQFPHDGDHCLLGGLASIDEHVVERTNIRAPSYGQKLCMGGESGGGSFSVDELHASDDGRQ